ncbi:hypothetical protein [Bradyrhizobium genomosp. III]|uniref:hypothetical protein n=1 Tax=Bradyrhizobium genomosp. III TaxID=2683271 RepID=UPI0004B332DD|nr:hypothetical protein [Bradyrhizobium sp. CCBAU 15544]
MTVATFQTAIDGVNPFVVEGPAVLGSGVIVPQYRLGHVAYGDAETEWVYCKYTSVSNQVLSPGLLFTVDDDYTATLLTTSNSPRGSKVMVCGVGLGVNGQSVTTVTGSDYYLWLARAGQMPVKYTTVATLGNLAETTATGGAANFPNSATVSSKLIVGLYITKAVGGTFTGTTTNGSPIVTGVTGLTPESGPSWIGSTLSATGIAASQTISSIQYNGTQITGITLSANATASGTVTITNSLLAQARILWPYIDKTN